MASQIDASTKEQATALGAGKEARLSFDMVSAARPITISPHLTALCFLVQVLHFFYDLTSVEQVRHFGCYQINLEVGAFRNQYLAIAASSTQY